MVALILAAFPLIRRAVYPYTIFFQTVPIIAIAPLLVIIIGFGLWICAEAPAASVLAAIVIGFVPFTVALASLANEIHNDFYS